LKNYSEKLTEECAEFEFQCTVSHGEGVIRCNYDRITQMSLKPIFSKRLPYYCVVFLVFLLTGCQAGQYEFNGRAQENTLAADFVLSGPDFSALKLSDFAGQITMLYFGYTSCPDVCPATLADVRWVFGELAELEEQVEFLFISVDPLRDTPDKQHRYLQAFHPRFIGLWGAEDQLETVMQLYDIAAVADEPDSDGNYWITHTSRLYLIDKAGYIRTSYPFDTARELILEDLQYLLTE
jgi:protein SCO1